MTGEAMRVGDWCFEPALNLLTSAGTAVKLEPKVTALLAYLAERPGDVVTRDALLAALWPGVVVGDDSLTQAVIKLRKALGDAAAEPVYIQTIAKGGYRLVAPVSPAAPVEPPSATARPAKRWLAAGAATAIAVAAGAWWLVGSRGASEPPAPAPRAPTAQAEPPTVTIRPFVVLDDDPRAGHLARGLAADLVTDLSKVSGITVVTEGAPGDAPRSGYLVSATVQRVDRRLRVQVHLAEAASGKTLWSERYERPLEGFFAMQDELGPAILRTLPAKVSEAELRRVAHRHTRNLEAYELFQRGQAGLLGRNRMSNAEASDLFRKAIALDASFARAYAALALTHAANYRNGWGADRAASLARAFDIARTAHEIDPDIPETHWVLALVHVERREHEKALERLEAAVRLSPSYADAYALMGGVHTYAGRPAKTVPLLRKAMRLDPRAGALYFQLLGRAYLFLDDVEQARVNLEHALQRNPLDLETHVYLAALHVRAGDLEAAAWEGEEIRMLQPGFSTRAWLQNYPMTDAAQREKLIALLAPVAP